MAADDPSDLPDDPADAPEAQVIRSADGLLLRGALEELPVEFREAVSCAKLEGFSYKEIAEATARRSHRECRDSLAVGALRSRCGNGWENRTVNCQTPRH